MYNNNTLIDAISNIDDRYLDRYFNKKEKQSNNKVRRIVNPKLKWVSLVAACLALVISVSFGIWINKINNNPTRANDYSLVKLYNNAQKLFFIDAHGQSGLNSYNLVDGSINTEINKKIGQAALTDTELFFTTSAGLYMKSLETGEEEKVMDFSGAKTDSASIVNDKPLVDNAVAEGCSDFNKSEGIVYFLYSAEKKLSYDEHNIIGNERWNTIYAFDLTSRELSEIKSTHNICSYLSGKDFVTDRPETPVSLSDNGIYNLHFYNGALYYVTDSAEIRFIQADGTNDNAIYDSNGTIRNIIWNDSRGYISETVEYDNNVEAYHSTLSLNENAVISAIQIELSLFSTFDNLCYDKANDRFYTIYENNVISFEFDNPSGYTVLYSFDSNIDSKRTNLIVAGGDLFCSYYDAVSNNSDYYIIRISNNQEEIIVKNGAPYDE